MKNKIFVYLLILLLLSVNFVACACGCKHEWIDATSKHPKTCLRCGKTEGEKLSAWSIDYFVDDFGDYTKNSYIKGEFYGTFSDSATSGSDLKVIVSIVDVGSVLRRF